MIGFGAEYGGYGAQNKDAQGATVVVGGLVLHAKLAGPDADVSHLGLGESAEEPGAVVVPFDVGKVAVELDGLYLVLEIPSVARTVAFIGAGLLSEESDHSFFGWVSAWERT